MYNHYLENPAALESYTSEMMCDLYMYMKWTNEIKNWTKIVAVVIVYEKDHA